MDKKDLDIEKYMSEYSSAEKLRHIYNYENNLDFSHNMKILKANCLSFENIDDFFINLPDVYFSRIDKSVPKLSDENRTELLKKTKSPAGKKAVLQAAGEELGFAEILGPKTKFKQLWQIKFTRYPPDDWNPDDEYQLTLLGETDTHFFYLDFFKSLMK